MKNKIHKKSIIVIGGGTGVFTLLSGLKNYFEDLTAIVTMADDGGSTGMLREDFGILPPGDVRRALVALAKTDDKLMSDLFNYRFAEGQGLVGHSFGNLMLAALERVTGNFEHAIREASKILGVQGRVIPVTLAKTKLYAELENGQVIRGETNIDIPHHDGTLKIKKVWLEPEARINKSAEEAILNADMVVIGPGDLYTSILPNIVVRGVKEALKKTKAKKVYVTNLMTKFGETHAFKASDFLKVVEQYIGKNVIDYVVVNNKKPSPERLRSYVLERASWVEFDKENFDTKAMLVETNLLRPRGFIRHDSGKTAELLKTLV